MKKDKFDEFIAEDPWFPWEMGRRSFGLHPKFADKIDLRADRPLGATEEERRNIETVRLATRDYIAKEVGFIAVRPFERLDLDAVIYEKRCKMGASYWSEHPDQGIQASLFITYILVYTVADKIPRPHQRFRQSKMVGIPGNASIRQETHQLQREYGPRLYLDAVVRHIIGSMGPICRGSVIEVFKFPLDYKVILK